MVDLLCAYIIGVYVGFQLFAPYKGKEFLTERCTFCNGSGMVNKIDYITDCPKCFCGMTAKKGFMPMFYKVVFKWVSL